jgi:hypothetical protein
MEGTDHYNPSFQEGAIQIFAAHIKNIKYCLAAVANGPVVDLKINLQRSDGSASGDSLPSAAASSSDKEKDNLEKNS